MTHFAKPKQILILSIPSTDWRVYNQSSQRIRSSGTRSCTPESLSSAHSAAAKANTQSLTVPVLQAGQPITWEKVKYDESLPSLEGQLHLVLTWIYNLFWLWICFPCVQCSDQTLSHPLSSLLLVHTVLLLTKEPTLQPLMCDSGLMVRN